MAKKSRRRNLIGEPEKVDGMYWIGRPKRSGRSLFCPPPSSQSLVSYALSFFDIRILRFYPLPARSPASASPVVVAKTNYIGSFVFTIPFHSFIFLSSFAAFLLAFFLNGTAAGEERFVRPQSFRFVDGTQNECQNTKNEEKNIKEKKLNRE